VIDQEEQTESATPDDSSKDAALLKEIRDRYSEWTEAWREAREHRKVLMRYLCGDPWDEKDRCARDDAGRPCISHDELNQYVFQCVNSARQSKRGIKIEPAGSGATEKSAELRQDIARTIEYQSKAQSVYLKAYQDEVEGGYGFARVSRRYVNDETDEQEIVIRPIPNPDSVVYDPYCKEPDWSDARGVFIIDPVPYGEFKTLYPKARITNFGKEERDIAGDWLTEKTVTVAEYWRLETEVRTSPRGKREVEVKSICQYVTNGVEILEKNPQPGKEVPIPVFLGLERYVDDETGGPRRRLFALPSFALDPQMSLAYLVSQEAEEAGLTPKSPWSAYVGQAETDAEAIESSTKVPRALLQWDVVVDGTGAVLPKPDRTQFTPNFQAYEVAKESARRAIQAAMGISPLPTQAQRQNEKSGIALQEIKQQQDIGSFHFVDGYERALTRIGRIVNDWIPVTYDTKREMWLHQADETRRKVTLNLDPETDEADEDGGFNLVSGDEDHDVTVGTGPSAASEEQAASQFLDLLVQNLQQIPPPGSPQAKLLALAIQMKQLGPKGDEIVDILNPPQQGDPAQAIAQTQQQLQQMHAYSVQLEQKLQQLTMEKQAKIIDNQYETERQIRLKQMQIDADQKKGEVQIAVAEIQTKAQSLEERMQFVEDLAKQFHAQAHDVALEATKAKNAQVLAQQQAINTAAQSAQDQQQTQPQEAAAG
jgi:Phage P22-like portal protein